MEGGGKKREKEGRKEEGKKESKKEGSALTECDNRSKEEREPQSRETEMK